MMPPAAGAEIGRAAAGLERRVVLRLLGAAAAAGLLPSGCGGAPRALEPPPGPPLLVLTPRGYATFTAAAARLVGPTGAGLIAERTLDVGRAADRLLARSPALGAPLGQALLALEFGIRPLVAKWRPFTALEGTAQDAVLGDLMTSRWEVKRQLFAGVRALALLAFYGSPASRIVSGYPGPFGSERTPIGAAMTRP